MIENRIGVVGINDRKWSGKNGMIIELDPYFNLIKTRGLLALGQNLL